jgi:hypothetical protein
MQHCNCLPIVAALLLQACCTHAFLAPAPIHTRLMQYAARCTMSSSSEPQEQSTGVSRRDLFSGKPINILYHLLYFSCGAVYLRVSVHVPMLNCCCCSYTFSLYRSCCNWRCSCYTSQPTLSRGYRPC